MPIWAILYCTFIVIASLATIRMKRDRPSYYIPGELLSTLCYVMIFFYYFGVSERPDFWVIGVMLAYILYWELWENRSLYLEEMATRENHEVSTRTEEMFFTLLFTLVLLSPLFYVTLRLILSYF